MLFKSFIYSFTGFCLGFFNILEKFNENIIKFIFSLFIPLSLCIINYKPLSNKFSKFDFLFLDILISVIFIIFGYLPFHKIQNKFIILFIRKITSYTGGIYYMHLEIWQLLKDIQFMNNHYLARYFTIYIISYIFSNIGHNLFGNSKIKYLFI